MRSTEELTKVRTGGAAAEGKTETRRNKAQEFRNDKTRQTRSSCGDEHH